MVDTAIREKPVLFSAPMVRALLAGTKTQTRRVVKLPHMNPLGQWEPTTFGGPDGGRTRKGETIPEHAAIWHTRTGDCIGARWLVGNRLWVREGWMDLRGTGCEAHDPYTRKPTHYAYMADTPAGSYADQCRKDYGLKWRPSIHMPRAASRILLEVTEVRVERLQDISEADCWAEGIEEVMYDFDNLSQCVAAKRIGASVEDAKPLYMQLWESINGPGSWDANPWVWAISFKRLMPSPAHNTINTESQ